MHRPFVNTLRLIPHLQCYLLSLGVYPTRICTVALPLTSSSSLLPKWLHRRKGLVSFTFRQAGLNSWLPPRTRSSTNFHRVYRTRPPSGTLQRCFMIVSRPRGDLH